MFRCLLYCTKLFEIMDNEFDVRGAEVVYSSSPPKPYNPLRRPKVSYKKPIVIAAVYFSGLLFCAAVFNRLFGNYHILLSVLWTVLFLGLFAKRFCIWSVHLYQAKASDATRLRCVFEPSCSEYMILAIEKYGLFKGVMKGCKRLLRCHSPNGGQDYP